MNGVIITGSRQWTEVDPIYYAFRDMDSELGSFSVVVGDAKGADAITDRLCRKLRIPFRVFKADWGLYGKQAGLDSKSSHVRLCPSAL